MDYGSAPGTIGPIHDLLPDISIVSDFLALPGRCDHERHECGLALGCRDVRVAYRAAELTNERAFSRLLVSGGSPHRSASLLPDGEANSFAAIIQAHGVPKESIIVERDSRNTAENMRFSRNLLETILGHLPAEILIVTRPYHARRAFCTARRHFPGVEICVDRWAPRLGLYFNDLPEYAELGDVEVTDVPPAVRDAALRLRGLK